MPLMGDAAVGTFEVWALVAEPKLRHALTASFGVQVGREAAADALSHMCGSTGKRYGKRTIQWVTSTGWAATRPGGAYGGDESSSLMFPSSGFLMSSRGYQQRWGGLRSGSG